MGILLPLKQFPQFSLDCGSGEPSNCKDILFVMETLLYVMNISLPIKSAPPTIIAFDESRACPTCYRQSNLIVLTSPLSQWSHVAYQLAHEMCHLSIYNEVDSNLRWLEESICELSSYYFLPRLSKKWRRSKIGFANAITKTAYYPEFERYAINDQKKAIPFDLSSLMIDGSSELQELVTNCELRDKNAHIANCLLPIFKRHPDTWHAVPLLGALSPNLPLQNSLSEWITLSPEVSRIGLQKLANLFGVSIPLS